MRSSSSQTPDSIAPLEDPNHDQRDDDSCEHVSEVAAVASREEDSGGGAESDRGSPKGPMLSLSCRRESPQKKPRNQTSAKVNQKTLVPEQMLDSLIEFIRERGGSTAVADMEEFYRMHPELGAKQVVAQCGGLRSFCGRNKHLIAYRAGCISLRNSASHTGHSSTSSPSSLDQEAEQSTAGERNIGRSGQHHHEENRHLHQQLEARRLVEQENEAAASVAASLLLKLSRTIQSPALTPTALSPREPCMCVRERELVSVNMMLLYGEKRVKMINVWER